MNGMRARLKDTSEDGNVHTTIMHNKHPINDSGAKLCQDFFWFLGGNNNVESRNMFWDQFIAKLKALEVTSMEFRKSCLFHRTRDGLSLLHTVCKQNPPLEVVKTLLRITPTAEGTRQFNHLSRTPNEIGGEYPLHMIARCGGTFDVVKLLVDTDTERTTLQLNSKNNSVFHVLAGNREIHDPDEFSDILQYLVLSIQDFGTSPLLQENSGDNTTPLLLLSGSLVKSSADLSMTELLDDRDFNFLTKATCYHYLKSMETAELRPGDRGIMRIELEKISLSRAFAICSTCFDETISSLFLKELLIDDSRFLLERDAKGQYPIHRMIQNPSNYLMNTVSNPHRNRKFCDFIARTIVSIVPVCAQLFNDEGRLPLQLATERNLKLVRAVWEAYPAAEGYVYSKAGTTTPALAQRDYNLKGTHDRECGRPILLGGHLAKIKAHLNRGKSIGLCNSISSLVLLKRRGYSSLSDGDKSCEKSNTGVSISDTDTSSIEETDSSSIEETDSSSIGESSTEGSS